MTEDSVNPMGGGEGEVAVDLAIVGRGFAPGCTANAKIAALLGHESRVEKGVAQWKINDEWQDTPAWCSKKGQKDATELLDQTGALYSSFKVDEGWIVVCMWRDIAFTTKPVSKEAAALACAAHHILLARKHKSRVT